MELSSKTFGTCNVFNPKQKSIWSFIRREVKWYKENGYRKAKRNEGASFNTVIIAAKRNRNWITLLEDSIEGLTIEGITIQAHVRALGNPIGPSLIFNYLASSEGQGALLAVSNESYEDIVVHVRDDSNVYMDALNYTDKNLAAPTKEEFKAFGNYKQADIDAIWNGNFVDEKHRIMAIAELVGLDASLATVGFHNFFEEDPLNLLSELSETHDVVTLTFRKDTKKLKEPTIQFEGVPVIQIERLRIMRHADRADVSFLVCNKGGMAYGSLRFALHGERIALNIRQSYQGGDNLIEVYNICASSHFDNKGVFLGEESRKRFGESSISYAENLGQYISFVALIECIPGGVFIPYKMEKKLKKEGKLHPLVLEGAIEVSFSISVKNGDTSGMMLYVCHAGNALNGTAKIDL